MTTACPPDGLFATQQREDFVPTKALEANAFGTAGASSLNSNATGAWDSVLDQLIKWGAAPSHVDEDDRESPSSRALTGAIVLLRHLRRDVGSVPTRLVEDGEGGLVAKWIRGPEVISLRFTESGKVEFAHFNGPHLVNRITD